MEYCSISFLPLNFIYLIIVTWYYQFTTLCKETLCTFANNSMLTISNWKFLLTSSIHSLTLSFRYYSDIKSQPQPTAEDNKSYFQEMAEVYILFYMYNSL